MSTEQELRTTLTRRADGAPSFDADRVLAAVAADRTAGVLAPRWHRQLAVAGAAVTVVGVTAVAVVLAQRPATPADAGGAPGRSAIAALPSTSAASSPTSSAPTTSAPTSSAPTTPTPTSPSTTPAGSQPAAIVRVTSPDRISSVDRRADVEFVTVQVGSQHTSVAGYRTGVFTAARVAHAVPVRVDGHPGLFGSVSVWPVNGRPDPRTGKQDSPQPSLAWRLGRGPWVVLQIDTPDHPTKAQLLAASQRVHVTRPG